MNLSVFRYIKDQIMVLLFYLFRVFPIKNTKIVVSMFDGKGYGSEGKAIVDRLLEMKKGLDIVWVCKNDNESMPDGVRAVKRNSLRFIYDFVTAKVWIDNRRKKIYFRKRRGQYYIQTWHGSVCIKKVEADAADTLKKRYVQSAINDSKMADLLVSGSKWRTRNMKSAFWYDGEILEADLYRTSKQTENMKIVASEVKKSLGISEHANIVLYAPTFRSDKNLDCYNINYSALLDAVTERFGGEWFVVVRLHPNMSEYSAKIEYSDHILNGSLFPQINDLICACNILISDFSGVIFSGFRFGKIVLLYASDYDKYITKERNLYFDYEKLPSPIAKSNAQLGDVIRKFDEEQYELRRKTFVDEIGFFSNDAAKELADIIIDKCRESKK